ncbi:MAG: hypothetical protein V4537_04690 [Pseudomonadota bacterium]
MQAKPSPLPVQTVPMIPIPTSRVFRSRRGALVWGFWVIVAAVMTVGFGDDPAPANGSATTAAATTDALGMPVDDESVKQLMTAMNAR